LFIVVVVDGDLIVVHLLHFVGVTLLIVVLLCYEPVVVYVVIV
jgi:hypothetical protein